MQTIARFHDAVCLEPTRPRPPNGLPLKGSTLVDKTASVQREGPGKQGQEQISTETGALERHPYGLWSRLEGDRRGTNPEESLGAALAHEQGPARGGLEAMMPADAREPTW